MLDCFVPKGKKDTIKDQLNNGGLIKINLSDIERDILKFYLTIATLFVFTQVYSQQPPGR